MRMGRGLEVEEATFLRGTGIVTHYFTVSEAEELFFPLTPLSIENRCWKMRARGVDLVRSRVEGVFFKGSYGPGPGPVPVSDPPPPGR